MADQQWAPKGDYPEGVQWNAPLRQETLIDMLNRSVESFPDNTALSHRGYKLSYKQLGDLVDRAARGLVTSGVKPGDRFGLFMPNTPQYPIMFFAALKAGAILVNFSSTYKDHPEKLAAQIADSGTTMMAVSDVKGFYSTAKTVLDEGKLQKMVVCPMNNVLPFWTSLLFRAFKKDLVDAVDSSALKFRQIVKSADKDSVLPNVGKDQLALLQYTNGTTGTPKGVMLTHFNVAANVHQLELMFGARPDRPADPMLMAPGQEKFLTSIPMFHVYGMTVGLLNAINIGAEIITVPDPRDTKGLLKLIDREKPTVFPAVPQMLNVIAQRKDIGQYDLTSLRCVTSGGAKLPPAVRTEFERVTGCKVKSGYGLSETSPVVTSESPGGKPQENSIGYPYPGTEMRVVNIDTFEDVADGQSGELWVRGPQVMQGYWHNEKATAEVLMPGNWLRTGDVGVRNADGTYSITGRDKRMANINGMKVSPETVEDVVVQHPSILECCIIRLNIGTEKEALQAIIRYRPDATDRPDTAGWRALLKDKLTDKEVPRSYEFRDTPLPLVGGIKPDYKLLEKEAAAAVVAPATTALNPQP